MGERMISDAIELEQEVFGAQNQDHAMGVCWCVCA